EQTKLQEAEEIKRKQRLDKDIESSRSLSVSKLKRFARDSAIDDLFPSSPIHILHITPLYDLYTTVNTKVEEYVRGLGLSVMEWSRKSKEETVKKCEAFAKREAKAFLDSKVRDLDAFFTDMSTKSDKDPIQKFLKDRESRVYTDIEKKEMEKKRTERKSPMEIEKLSKNRKPSDEFLSHSRRMLLIDSVVECVTTSALDGYRAAWERKGHSKEVGTFCLEHLRSSSVKSSGKYEAPSHLSDPEKEMFNSLPISLQAMCYGHSVEKSVLKELEFTSMMFKNDDQQSADTAVHIADVLVEHLLLDTVVRVSEVCKLKEIDGIEDFADTMEKELEEEKSKI
ncbi:hypothetical protein ADUPG1_000096, partial [Aduncisulcus paluster]